MEKKENTLNNNLIHLDTLNTVLVKNKKFTDPTAILNYDKPAEIIERLPTETLYFMLKTSAKETFLELLPYTTPEQIKGFIDLECWDKDRLDPKALLNWMTDITLVGKEKLSGVLTGLDIELLLVMLKNNIKAHEYSDDFKPDNPNEKIDLSPDNKFAISYIGGEQTIPVIKDIINTLYDTNLPLAFNTLSFLSLCIPSQLEETAYNLKTNRLMDLGFPSYHDAVSIYAYVNPRTKFPKEYKKLTLALDSDFNFQPRPYLEKLEEDSFFKQVLHKIENETVLEYITCEITWLVNKSIAANFAKFTDLDAVKEIAASSLNYLNIGLEFLSLSNSSRAAKIIRNYSLVTIFRVGFSLTLDLNQKAKKIIDSFPAILNENKEILFLQEPLNSILKASLKKRPCYPKVLEDLESQDQRDYSNYNEVLYVDKRLDYIDYLIYLLTDILHVDLTQISQEALDGTNIIDEASLTINSILNTMIANQIIYDNFVFKPIPEKDVSRFIKRYLKHKTEITNSVSEHIISIGTHKTLNFDFIKRSIESALISLDSEISNLDLKEKIEPNYLQAVVVKIN